MPAGLRDATGEHTRPEPPLQRASLGLPGDIGAATWLEAMEQAYRRAGAIAGRALVPGHADAQTILLARFGRRT